MMALGAWLKELIMIVLLAVFADLLLPTKAMQKYVRTVLGLGIIAVIVQPIVPFLNPNWVNHAVEIAFSEIEQSNSTGAMNENATISDYATTLQNEQQDQANQMVVNELLSSLPASYRPVVTGITVTGAALGTQDTHIVIIRIAGSVSSEQIQHWAANLLGLSLRQISVTS